MDASFFQSVFEVVRLIPAGRITSYGAIARYLGSGKSSRMVGWAMNASHGELPQVPAHRVVNRLGMLSGKMHFHPPEGIEVENDKVVRFKELFWDPSEALSL
jgi:methylated-DNA-protein-cysteine methyltransferase-like protein